MAGNADKSNECLAAGMGARDRGDRIVGHLTLDAIVWAVVLVLTALGGMLYVTSP